MAPAKKHSVKYRAKKANKSLFAAKAQKPWKLIAIVLVALGVVGSLVFWASSRAAGTATLSLTPATASVIVNQTVALQVRMNSGTEGVNVVDAKLTYPADKLEFVAIDATGSAFPDTAASSGGAGSVSIGRFIGPANTTKSVSGNQLVATVTFRALVSTGTALIPFTSDSVIARASDSSDILGSTSPSTLTLTLPPDTTPPTVSLTATPTAVIAGNNIALTTAVNDDRGTVSKVEFYEGTTLLATDTTSPFTHTYVTTSKSGTKSLTAKAYDPANNVGTSAAVSITITPPDTTAPVVSITASPTSVTRTESVTLTTTATDTVGVTKVEFFNGVTKIADGVRTSGTATNGVWTATWTTTSAPVGGHTITAKATDAANNVGTSASAVVQVSYRKGDVDGDNDIDGVDLSKILTNYTKALTARTDGNLNGDSVVNALDLSEVLTNYGK